MRRAILLAAVLLAAGTAWGSPIILRYRGAPLIFGADSQVVTPSFRKTFMWAELEMDKPLAPFLADTEISPLNWTVSSGYYYEHSVWCGSCVSFKFSTDAAGTITDWNFRLVDMTWPEARSWGTIYATSSAMGDHAEVGNLVAVDIADNNSPGAWTAQDVAEPPTLLLLGIGLGGILILKRRVL